MTGFGDENEFKPSLDEVKERKVPGIVNFEEGDLYGSSGVVVRKERLRIVVCYSRSKENCRVCYRSDVCPGNINR